ncbi:BTAD domain-containing putative transcriptional regulator [Streptomyces sp. NPDC058751]|uniref:AfsR/SARP family transcriptional regulator n=1 Tax=Streptomyces sp. NPDC058751 TaxID=3346623 RepID=UPI0036798837
MLFFSVLGHVEVRARDRVFRLAGTMQQSLLAALLVSRGGLVTVDSLILELWGGEPPSKVQNALQAQVSRVRRSLALLEPERPGSRVITTPSGYLFSVGRQELDAHVFMDTVDRVRRAVADDGSSAGPAQDIRELRRALSFWSGPVFGGLRVGPLCQAVAARYAEARNAALTLLFELELTTGPPDRILPELAEAYEQNPTNEKLCMLLMGALYRCGRQRDALDVYRKCRRTLVDDLGVDPTPALRRYEKAILNHDAEMLREPVGHGGRMGM